MTEDDKVMFVLPAELRPSSKIIGPLQKPVGIYTVEVSGVVRVKAVPPPPLPKGVGEECNDPNCRAHGRQVRRTHRLLVLADEAESRGHAAQQIPELVLVGNAYVGMAERIRDAISDPPDQEEDQQDDHDDDQDGDEGAHGETVPTSEEQSKKNPWVK